MIFPTEFFLMQRLDLLNKYIEKRIILQYAHEGAIEGSGIKVRQEVSKDEKSGNNIVVHEGIVATERDNRVELGHVGLLFQDLGPRNKAGLTWNEPFDGNSLALDSSWTPGIFHGALFVHACPRASRCIDHGLGEALPEPVPFFIMPLLTSGTKFIRWTIPIQNSDLGISRHSALNCPCLEKNELIPEASVLGPALGLTAVGVAHALTTSLHEFRRQGPPEDGEEELVLGESSIVCHSSLTSLSISVSDGDEDILQFVTLPGLQTLELGGRFRLSAMQIRPLYCTFPNSETPGSEKREHARTMSEKSDAFFDSARLQEVMDGNCAARGMWK
ncbi:hypothetical protein B0H14DRAFT_2606593 [Mycena olivaceomarginata]|nr:hypothetical protein B0H14DRAFT_2606593 [Mycena olivaceomarginata]